MPTSVGKSETPQTNSSGISRHSIWLIWLAVFYKEKTLKNLGPIPYTQEFSGKVSVSHTFLFPIWFPGPPAGSTCGQVAPSLLRSPRQVVKRNNGRCRADGNLNILEVLLTSKIGNALLEIFVGNTLLEIRRTLRNICWNF